MPDFNLIGAGYWKQQRRMIGRAYAAVLLDLERKPDIVVKYDVIRAMDATVENDGPLATGRFWPCRIHTDDYLQLLTYKGLDLGISLWENVGGVSLSFPLVVTKVICTRRNFELPGEVYHTYEDEYCEGTTAKSNQNVDHLYEQLQLGYKRYQAKLKRKEKREAQNRFDIDQFKLAHKMIN